MGVAANYQVSGGMTVSAVAVDSMRQFAQTVVTLTVNGLSDGTPMSLTVNGVRDRARTPNAIDASRPVSFTYRAAPSLTCSYYELESVNKVPAFDTLSSTKDTTMASVAVPPGVRSTNYALRFAATFPLSVGGAYTFSSSSDDGSVVYVDNSMVVNNDGAHGPKTVTNAVTLTASDHLVTVGFFQGGGGASLDVVWTDPAGRTSHLDTMLCWAEAGFTPQVPVTTRGFAADRGRHGIPVQFAVAALGPDRFSAPARLRIAVPASVPGSNGGEVVVVVRKTDGRTVQTVHAGMLAPGTHTVAIERPGQTLAPGFYLCTARVGSIRKTVTLVKVR